LQTLVNGLSIGESPRWHDNRLWLSNWGAEQVIAVDLEGHSEVMEHVPSFNFSIDWLPDGRLLVVSGPRLLRREAGGSLVTHADLDSLPGPGSNEIVVDGRGNIYVNGGCDFQPGEDECPGFILLITPDGSVRRVADELAFPNGMVITPDNSTLVVVESFAAQLTAYDIAEDGTLSNRRVWAPRTGDGITMDADGAIWASTWSDDGKPACHRVAEGGEILDTVLVDQACFACALGGPDGRTLYLLTADWHMQEPFDTNLDRLLNTKTGQLLTATAPTPKAGHP